jgi:hypothetical protein
VDFVEISETLYGEDMEEGFRKLKEKGAQT